MTEPPRFNGAHVATVLSAALSIFALGAVQVWTELDPANKAQVFDIGTAWMPGAEGIGPYSGKETIMLVTWLVAWGVLHLALRHKTLDPRPWFGMSLVFILLGVLGIWPPVWHALAG